MNNSQHKNDNLSYQYYESSNNAIFIVIDFNIILNDDGFRIFIVLITIIIMSLLCMLDTF